MSWCFLALSQCALTLLTNQNREGLAYKDVRNPECQNAVISIVIDPVTGQMVQFDLQASYVYRRNTNNINHNDDVNSQLNDDFCFTTNKSTAEVISNNYNNII